MYNLLLSLPIALVTLLALWLPGLLKAYEASLPALLAAMVAYVLLARRSFKQAEALFTQAAGSMQAQATPGAMPKFDRAIGILKQAYKLAPWQLGIRSQVDGQIGMILYMVKEFNDAQPYLERAASWGHWMAGAMLAVLHYKKKQPEQMKTTFELVVKKGKKETLPWNLYAYCLAQLGEQDAAMKVLQRGMKAIKEHDKLEQNLLALQNGKKMKMRQLYNEQWYQFHLDRPPVQMMATPFSAASKKRRRPIA